MDGENTGKPYEQMDDLGVFPLFLETPTPNSFGSSNHLQHSHKLQRDGR